MQARDYRKKIHELILTEELLLPDFQREFVWKPQEQQLKLACSLFLDIPIGSILVLDELEDIGFRKLCYKEEEVSLSTKSKLLMDGQQRISTIKSIFSDLYRDINGWKLINRNLHSNLRYRWFFDLSLENLLDSDNDLERKLNILCDFYWKTRFEDYDIEDIKSLLSPKKVLTGARDYDRWHPSQEIEKLRNYCSEESLIPLFLVLSDKSSLIQVIRKISKKYIEFLLKNKSNEIVEKHYRAIKDNFYTELNLEVEESKIEAENIISTNIDNFFNDHIIYKEIYGIEYEKSQLNKAIVTFNTMNTGGISLGVFDIISAKYSKLGEGRLAKKLLDYANSFINKIHSQDVKYLIEEKFLKSQKNLVNKNFSDMYLNMLSIFTRRAEEEEFKLDCIKQKSLLKLRTENIQEESEKVVEALILAFEFLITKCGTPSIKDIKYKLTVIPLAYNLYQIKNEESEKIKRIESKIEYSYWMSIFSGKYEKAQNAFSIDHLNNLISFINDSENNVFNSYKSDLCNKKGYSDFEGFKSFYEENSYSYSSNIGEYFLQFILSRSIDKDIFNHDKEGKKIEIKHFQNLEKDHIIPKSWIGGNTKVIDSVLNKFYSPEVRNRKRSNKPIAEDITENGIKVLCIDTGTHYTTSEFNTEAKIKNSYFLNKRFKLFKETIESHLKNLEEQWKK